MRKIILLTPLLALFSLFTFNAFGADITCSAGEFLSKDNKCETCWANYYCKGGTWTPDDKDHGLDQCPDDKPYSDKGAKGDGDCYAKTTDITCSAGEFLSKENKCETCWANYYCKGGTWTPDDKEHGLDLCPTTAPYSNQGAKSESDCYAKTTDITCSAGEFLPAFSYSDCRTCPAGFYCKGGKYPYSETNDQGIEKCPATSPFSESGSDDSSDCKANLVCLAGTYLGGGSFVCSICSSGNYCVGGTFTNNTSTQGITKCDTSTPFSPAGATSSTQCSATIDCGAGEFLPVEKTVCESCWEGYYCDGTKSPYSYDSKNHQGLTQCPDDKPYSDKGAKGEGDCYGKTIECEGGYYLPMGSEKCTICPSGSYCIGLKGAMVDKTKDQGIDKCPSTAPYSKTGTPDEKSCFDTTTCKEGEFLPVFSSADCKTCPAGSYCKGGKYPYSETGDQGITKCDTSTPFSPAGATSSTQCSATINCAEGELLKAGSTQCDPCWGGYYCKGGKYSYSETSDQGLTQCPATAPYSNPGAKSESDCYAKTIDCNGGYYLPMGSDSCKTCPAGSYCKGGKYPYSETGDQGIEKCPTTAPYSASGTPDEKYCFDTTTCKAGEFLPAFSSAECKTCYAGYYCKGGKYPYSETSDQGIEQCDKSAPFSEYGSDDNGDCKANLVCLAGTYLIEGMLTCVPCPAGYWCGGGTFTNNTSTQGITQCDAATPFSPAGATSSTQCSATIDCGAGTFLPQGDIQCKDCKEGYFCDGTKSPYSYDSKNHQGLTQCPATAPYSNQGAKSESDCYAKTIDCEGGYYLNMGGDKCAICPSGSYCIGLKGAMVDKTKDQGIDKCPTTAPYSKSGAPDEKSCFDTPTCKNGEFLPAFSSECETCYAGSYCKGGKYPYSETSDQGIEKCPTTSPFSEEGSDDNGDCKANLVCLAGTYLSESMLTCSTCPAGYWCNGGTFTNNTSTQGMTKCDSATPFSPAGATSSTQCSATIDCGAGELLKAGSTQCDPCWEGYYCDGTKSPYSYDDKNDQGLTQCPATAPYSNPGAKSESDCYAMTYDITCGAGEFLSKDNKCETCGANYYCKGGTWTPDNKEHGLDLCPSTAPYSNPGAKSESDCYAKTDTIDCNTGYYLPMGSEKCTICPFGSYCIGIKGVTVDKTKDQGIEKCPSTAPYSNQGAKSESDCYAEIYDITCSAGEYLPKDKDEACAECLEGYYCEGGGFNKGQGKDQGLTQCPATAPYSDKGAKSDKDCYAKTTTIDCETGYYLPMGFDKCDICPSGSYCKGGKYSYSETGDQGIEKCPTTSPFSEYGSDDSSDCKANLVCLAGTYLGESMLTCSTCPAGYWCSGGTFTNNTSTQGITKCDSATPFSPAGATSSTQCSATIDCAEGELLKAGGTQCDPCWEGYFCSGAKGLSFNDKEDQGLSECSKVDSNNPLSDLGAKSADDCYAAKCEAGEYLPEKSTKCESCPKAQSCNGGNFKYSAKGSQGFTYSCDAGYYLPADSEDCALCPSDYYCPGFTDIPASTINNKIYGRESCPTDHPSSDAGTTDVAFCYYDKTGVDCSTLVKILNTTSVSYANSPVTQRNYNGGASVVIPFGGCAVTGATCSNADEGEVLVGTDGPLANYESPLYGMPSSTSNHNIYYRAIDGDSAGSSGANGYHGDSTGMTNGTFRLVYWNELDITGTASCAVNANGKYDCNCDLTSYKIGSGNTVSVNPAERLFSKTDFVDSLSSCEKKCANTCATQLAPIPEFGSLGMNKSCGVPAQTYTCAPGTYLPANATVCATCTQNHWCGGGTWEKVSFAQGLEDCPSEFPYSDAGSRDVAFCYKEPSTLQCSAVNPVRGANATYANSTAATKKYNDGGIQTDTIGACAISSLTCDTGYTATNNWSDGPLVNYINASRNLDLSATKLKSNDGSTKSGTGEFFGGDATSLNKGTFELVYSNGTKIQGRSSCNSTSGDLFELKTNGTFDTLSVGKECWCNMTGYHLNGSSAVNVSDTNWVYWGAFGDINSCTTTCTKRCIQVLFQPENTNGEYENALFGAYGKNSVPPCKPNSYSITWYDGNNNLETNQCYYDEYLTIPSSTTARTGYKIKWQIRTGN